MSQSISHFCTFPPVYVQVSQVSISQSFLIHGLMKQWLVFNLVSFVSQYNRSNNLQIYLLLGYLKIFINNVKVNAFM